MADQQQTPTGKRMHSISSTSSTDSVKALPKKLRQQSPPVDECEEGSSDSSFEEALDQPKVPAFINWNEMLAAMTEAMADLDNPFTQQFTNVLNHSEKLSNAYERLDSLENKVAEKDVIIHDMQNDIEALTKRVEAKEDEIIDLRAELDEVKNNITEINDKQTSFEKQRIPEKLDELDQYRWHSMIHLAGVPETSENESTVDVVIDVVKKNLGIELTKSDIDRTHRLGPMDNKHLTPRPIVIKFSNYTSRSLVYGERRKLMGSGLFMNDHLTATRSRWLYIARQYKKKKLITNAWSAEGRILVRDKDDKKTYVILNLSDLTAFDPTKSFKLPKDTSR